MDVWWEGAGDGAEQLDAPVLTVLRQAGGAKKEMEEDLMEQARLLMSRSREGWRSVGSTVGSRALEQIW